MNCEQVTRVAGDYLEHRLRWRSRVEFSVHVAMCKGCREYVEQTRLTLLALHGLRALPDPAGPPPEELLERFRRERG